MSCLDGIWLDAVSDKNVLSVPFLFSPFNLSPNSTIHKNRGRYDSLERSIAVPFLKRPSNLDGSHAGDYGFDPLGFSESYDLYTMQESELRHGRLAMLAVVGWPISELVAPDWMLQDGRAPSVLNGVNPLSFIAIALALGGFGLFEYMTCFRASAQTPFGKKHAEDMAAVWKYGVAGDYNWDPMNWYTSIGDDPVARKGLREVEIAHGRQAMLGITAFAAWEALTGHPIVENSMFFHPNALLPLLVASYVGFNLFYEIKNTDQYVLQIEMTEEGKMKAESIQKFMEQNEETNQKIAETAEKAFEVVKEYAEKAKKQIEEANA